MSKSYVYSPLEPIAGFIRTLCGQIQPPRQGDREVFRAIVEPSVEIAGRFEGIDVASDRTLDRLNAVGELWKCEFAIGVVYRGESVVGSGRQLGGDRWGSEFPDSTVDS